MAVDFRLFSSPAGLSACVDLAPGRLTDRHYRGEWAFIEEGAFVVAEGFLKSLLADFDHYGNVEVDRVTGRRLVESWRGAAERLADMDANEAYFALKLDALGRSPADFWPVLQDLQGPRKLLLELAEFVETVLQANTHLSIRGV